MKVKIEAHAGLPHTRQIRRKEIIIIIINSIVTAINFRYLKAKTLDIHAEQKHPFIPCVLV